MFFLYWFISYFSYSWLGLSKSKRLLSNGGVHLDRLETIVTFEWLHLEVGVVVFTLVDSLFCVFELRIVELFMLSDDHAVVFQLIKLTVCFTGVGSIFVFCLKVFIFEKSGVWWKLLFFCDYCFYFVWNISSLHSIHLLLQFNFCRDFIFRFSCHLTSKQLCFRHLMWIIRTRIPFWLYQCRSFFFIRLFREIVFRLRSFDCVSFWF